MTKNIFLEGKMSRKMKMSSTANVMANVTAVAVAIYVVLVNLAGRYANDDQKKANPSGMWDKLVSSLYQDKPTIVAGAVMVGGIVAAATYVGVTYNFPTKVKCSSK
tara:strand:+ start:153 stop:470 length:318 start_codon:yes stop_codon:yes gene_type:complete